jgi:hypothetical protein
VNYTDLYDIDQDDDKVGGFPPGDDSVGKPKGKKGSAGNKKIGKGGTKKTKEGTTTSGPDDRFVVGDENKAHPKY